MSLFSGIKFSSDTAKTLAAELKASECAAGVPSSAPAAAAAAPVVNPLLAGPSKGAPASSASLQFAPRRPKPAASRPGPPSSHHVNVHSTPTVSALVEAAPVLIVPPRSEAHAPKEQQVVLGGDGQPVVRAPATTLKEVQRKRKKKASLSLLPRCIADKSAKAPAAGLPRIRPRGGVRPEPPQRSRRVPALPRAGARGAARSVHGVEAEARCGGVRQR